MAVTVTFSNHCKYQFMTGKINLSTDEIKVLLMRSGFVFNEDNHATLLNLKANTGLITISVNSVNRKFTRTSGSFITDGFVAGNYITTSGFTNTGNNGVWLIESVTDTEIVVTNGTGMVNETGNGDEQIVADDELPTGNGYVQDDKLLGTVTIVEDDTNNRAEATYPTVTWTATGGSIGPTAGAILYDATTDDNTIICYINFGEDQIASDSYPFIIASGTLRIL